MYLIWISRLKKKEIENTLVTVFALILFNALSYIISNILWACGNHVKYL